MAEVITHWPQQKAQPVAQFIYPWGQWARLDANGHGDIWLAEQGIDFPETLPVVSFRGMLYNRTVRENAKRKRDAPMILKPVRVRTKSGDVVEKVRRVPDFRPLRIKVVTVSDEQVAFQFYDSPEPPPEPEVIEVALPRRKPLHRIATRRTLERVYA